jgi:hypothetical protein
MIIAELPPLPPDAAAADHESNSLCVELFCRSSSGATTGAVVRALHCTKSVLKKTLLDVNLIEKSSSMHPPPKGGRSEKWGGHMSNSQSSSIVFSAGGQCLAAS